MVDNIRSWQNPNGEIANHYEPCLILRSPTRTWRRIIHSTFRGCHEGAANLKFLMGFILLRRYLGINRLLTRLRPCPVYHKDIKGTDTVDWVPTDIRILWFRSWNNATASYSSNSVMSSYGSSDGFPSSWCFRDKSSTLLGVWNFLGGSFFTSLLSNDLLSSAEIDEYLDSMTGFPDNLQRDGALPRIIVPFFPTHIFSLFWGPSFGFWVAVGGRALLSSVSYCCLDGAPRLICYVPPNLAISTACLSLLDPLSHPRNPIERSDDSHVYDHDVNSKVFSTTSHRCSIRKGIEKIHASCLNFRYAFESTNAQHVILGLAGFATGLDLFPSIKHCCTLLARSGGNWIWQVIDNPYITRNQLMISL